MKQKFSKGIAVGICLVATGVLIQKGVVWGYFGYRSDITESLGFVQDAWDVMVRFGDSVVFAVCTSLLQGGEPVCHDCLVVNGTSKLTINISSRYGC